jgi:hypothetical protein
MYARALASVALTVLLSGTSLFGVVVVRGQQSESCQAEEDNAASCPSFASVEETYACSSCIKAALDNSLDFICKDFVELLCPLLEDPAAGCPCDGCQYLMQELLKCNFASGRTCPFTCGYDSNNEQETLSPTPCALERAAFAQCFEYQCGDADACDQCLVQKLDSLTATVCTDYANHLCPAITNDCPCSGCEKISERFLQCGFATGADWGCNYFLCDFDPDPVLDSPVCGPSPGQPAPAPAPSTSSPTGATPPSVRSGDAATMIPNLVIRALAGLLTAHVAFK